MITNKKIVIVGGGTAGYITALTLLENNKKYRSADFDIHLIESKEESPIGVGEGSTPPFMRWCQDVNISVDDINGTYKSGINYNNWYDNNLSKYNNWYHPFYTTKFDKLADLIKNYNYESHIEESKEASTKYYSLHFEVSKLIPLLKYKCFGHGLKFRHYYKNVIDSRLDKDGNITSVILDDNNEIEGDLFIDCSGFKRVLISKMNPKIIDYSDKLLCDRALVTRLNTSNDKKFYWTKATALSTGWVWNIPLKDKTGTGYVYSSKFISDEDAKKEFNEYLDTNQDFRVIEWKQQAIEKPFINRFNQERQYLIFNIITLLKQIIL